MNLFLTPEVLLLSWTLILILLECFAPKMDAGRFAKLSIIGILFTLLSTVIIPPYKAPLWAGLYIVDGLSIFFKRLFLVAAFFVLWMAHETHSKSDSTKKEFFILPLITTIGMLLLASAADFITLFVSLELVTISFYLLVAYQKKSAISLEAGIKYLILGALSTAFFVYGIAFLIGTTGTTHFSTLAYRLTLTDPTHVSILFAMTLIAIGLAFKVAAVPFHSWAPDVYQGAPTPITAFLAVGSKAAGIVVLIRIFCINAFGANAWIFPSQKILGTLALLSVILGTFTAVQQTNIKRLLAYSGIAHAGFLLMSLGCVSDRGLHAVFFYMGAYLLAVLLAFFIISLLESKLGEEISDYSGLSRKSPLLAFALLVSFMSLAGIPPFIGFFAKLLTLAAVWEMGRYWLFVVGILGALVGVYYYFSLVRFMYWHSPKDNEPLPITSASKAIILLLVIFIIILGVWPEPFLQMIEHVLIPLNQGGVIVY